MKTIQKFQLYSPFKKQTEPKMDSGRLEIEGIASTTSKDLDNEYVSKEAILTMKEQAPTLNIMGDHNYDLFSGVIGTITEVKDSDEETLIIKGLIMEKYSKDILDMLNTGVNLGFSIGGFVTDYDENKNIIQSIDLKEISLTAMPANWDTFGTVKEAGVTKSTCLTGACYNIIKEIGDNMAEDNNQNNPKPSEEAPSLSDAQKQEVIDLYNELRAEDIDSIKQETIDAVKNDIENMIDSKIKEAQKPEKNDEEPMEEDKACGDGSTNEDEDKTKHLTDAITKSIDAKFDELFKNLTDNREPVFESTTAQVETEPVTSKKTYTSSEIAGILAKNSIDDLTNLL